MSRVIFASIVALFALISAPGCIVSVDNEADDASCGQPEAVDESDQPQCPAGCAWNGTQCGIVVNEHPQGIVVNEDPNGIVVHEDPEYVFMDHDADRDQ